MNLKSKRAVLLLLCFGVFFYTSAQTVNTDFATQINNTLSGLDKSKVPNKFLKHFKEEIPVTPRPVFQPSQFFLKSTL